MPNYIVAFDSRAVQAMVILDVNENLIDMTMNGTYLYYIRPSGTEIREVDLVTKAITRSITLSFTSGNDRARGIAWNGSAFAVTIYDSTNTNQDRLGFFDPSGTPLSESTVFSDGKTNQHRKLAFNGVNYWVLDQTVKIVELFSPQAQYLNGFSLIADNEYRGIAWDGESLWLSRSDANDSGTGSIEEWSVDGVLKQNLAFPSSVIGVNTPVVARGATMLSKTDRVGHRIYKVFQCTGDDAPVDVM